MDNHLANAASSVFDALQHGADFMSFATQLLCNAM
jgi:hypothetical protein